MECLRDRCAGSSQVCSRWNCEAAPWGRLKPRLQNFGQLSCKGAAGRLFAVFAAAAFAVWSGWNAVDGCAGDGRLSTARRSILTFGRLSGISAQQAVFQGSPIKSADDGLHLIAGGRFDEREAFGLLGFVISDHLY